MDIYRSYKHFKIKLSTGFMIILVLISLLQTVECQLVYDPRSSDDGIDITQRDYIIGPCLVSDNDECPDEEVTFILYSNSNPEERYEIIVNDTNSNLNEIKFDPMQPTKIIVHGYNSDMELGALVEIKNEYMKKYKCNIIGVDWRRLATAPCYSFAVSNAKHVGECLAQLIDRIRETGAEDIHIIGFSLGAHVPAFAANKVRPYKVPRITGLDPAMPFFITVPNDAKLNSEDAEFVDVYHTNAFIQGKIEQCGHVDFYMNGGINQPGCWEKRNPFGCDHHRAPEYFAESINSKIGFWGWPCAGFFSYLVGYCPPKLPLILAGDRVDKENRGFHLVRTNTQSPYANDSIILEDYRRNHRSISFRKIVKRFEWKKF